MHPHGQHCITPRLRVHPASHAPWAHLDEPTGNVIGEHDRGATWKCPDCGQKWTLRESREASHEYIAGVRHVYWESA